MITAYLVLLDFASMRTAETVRPIEPVSADMKPVTYVLISAFLVFAAIVILFIITPLNPSVVSQEAGYGIGLGLLLFISGTLVKIYRKTEYGE